ncbi:MAG: DUF4097 domain-containing protein [Treponema sp.]|jgi:hypothetical protein|nr:DUF4097 domain-containing protein [Treponema sp.]
MAKKGLFVLVIAALAAGGAFAQVPFTFSAGVGGFFGGDFGGGLDIDYTVLQLNSTKTTIDTPYFGGGGYAFLDAKYVEVVLGIYKGSGKLRMKQEAKNNSSLSIQQESDISIINFNIGLFMKYPFRINKISIYPIIGMDYHFALSVKDEDGDEYKNLAAGTEDPSEFNALWFNFGGGADYLFTEKMYLRFEALYSIRGKTLFEKDLNDYFMYVVSEVPVPGGGIITALPRIGHGLTARLAIGFKLY